MIFTDIPACSGSSYSLGWWDKADGVIYLLYWVSRTAASEQPSDNFAGLYVDFLVDEGNSSPVINYHSVHCLDFLSHNSVFKDNWSNLYPISQPKGLCFSGCIPIPTCISLINSVDVRLIFYIQNHFYLQILLLCIGQIK